MKCCQQLPRKAETICRWTAFGLICLSWLFVVSSTGTCAFVVNDSRSVELGLFCLRPTYIRGNNKLRYSDQDADLPGALVAARLFGIVACLTISAALVTISLVIFVLPVKHAVRAWWTCRILFCVSLFCVFLTFTMHSATVCSSSCSSGPGSILNTLNVLLLIATIVISFLIEVPEKALCGLFPGAASALEIREGNAAHVHNKPTRPSTTRTEMQTPDGKKLIREVITYPNGRQEVTETETDEEYSRSAKNHIVPSEQTFYVLEETRTPAGTRKTVETVKHTDGRHEVVETVEEPSMIGPFYVLEETRAPAGTRKTVETMKHADGRHEVVETVEEPSMIGQFQPSAHYEERAETYPHDEEGRYEVCRTRGEMLMPDGNLKVVEEIEYSDGTKEVLESIEEPTMVGINNNILSAPSMELLEDSSGEFQTKRDSSSTNGRGLDPPDH